jgi:LysM repeat protein
VEEVDGDVYRLRFADGCRLTHRDGLGRWPGERAAAFGFPRPWAVGENIASSWGRDPVAALWQWQESPGHDANQRRPDYALAGAGTVCIHYTGSVFVLQRPSFCFYVINFALGENQGAGEVEQPQPASTPNQASSGPTSAPGPTLRAGSGGGADQGATAGDPCVGRKVALAPEEMVIYRVAPGDTLAALAARFLGDAQRYCDLAAWNDIRAPYWLQVGQELKVPASAGGDMRSEPAQDEGRQQEGGAQEGEGEERATSEEMAPPEEEHGSDVLAVGGAEDGQAAATEVATQNEGGGHPVVSFIGRLLRRLRELWPF